MLSKRIKLLPSYTINQIAAGEVIERPASVLKELLENSIDSAPTQIDVFIHDGGLRCLEVRDNGCGIVKEDLPLTIMANATSKLTSIDDLLTLNTLGFRGEALASIDAVAELQISSRSADDALAWLQNAGQLLPTSHPIGTSVKVANLFYKVPVRKKFLRSARTEFIYLEQVWLRLVLSNFNIGFALHHNDKLIKKVLACADINAQEQRVQTLVGNLKNKILYVDATHDDLSLTGWISIPEHTQTTNEHQYIYLNQRFVKDKLLTHAIKQAYSAHLLPGKQPFYCVYLTMPALDFDVNVHPTKLEVRFKDARRVHDFILTTLEKLLQVPLNIMGTQIYKLPLLSGSDHAPLNASASARQQISVLDNRMVIFEDSGALEFIDLIQLKNALLQQVLTSATEKYELIKPIIVEYSLAHINQAQLSSLGIEVDAFNASSLIVRALPKIVHDLKLTINYPQLFSLSKSSNLLQALCTSSYPKETIDITTWLSLAKNLQIQSTFFKKTYHCQQLLELLF
jgi:DNA mismatch repair protein MutL